MSLFSFLEKAANTVGHDVSTVARGNNSPGGGIFGFLANATKTAYPQTTQPQGQVNPNSRPISLAPNPNNFGIALPIAQGIARTAPEVAQTIIHPFSQSTYTPGSAIEQGLFGSTPVQNIQAKVATNYQNHPNLNPILRVGLAGAEGVASVAQDAPVFSFLGKGLQTGAELASPALKAGANQFATANEIGAIGKDVSIPKPEDIHIPTNAGTIRISQDELNNLVKAQTPQDVKKIIGDALPQEITDRIAPGLALAKDPNIIQNIISKGVNDTLPRPPAPVVGNEIAPPSVSEPVNPAGQGTNEAINRHLQTIRNADSTSADFKEAILGLKQTHEMRDTEKLSNEAKATVEKDYTGSLANVLSNDNPTEKDVAVAAHLVSAADKAAQDAKAVGDMATYNSKLSEAVNVAEKTANTLLESGRTSQAGSIIARLSPEGQLLRATRIIQKARESNPKNIAKENKSAGEIQQTVEGSVPPFDKESVRSAVRDIASGQQKLDLGGLGGGARAGDNTGQALAKNVERAALPEVKKKADVLVQELTKKVKQEYLEPKASVQKSPLSILQEVFGRNAEAEEAYPLAQKILQDKYANVPQMKEALDKFFSSKLKLPAANTTINRAISDQLKTNGERVSDVIYKSLTTQEATVKNVSNDLVKEGFDQQSATKLAEEVARRLNQQVTEAKQSALARLGQDAKGRNQPTFLDKINKLSNLGALDKSDYLNLARAKLNMPHLRPDTAAKISDLSQKLQELPEGHDKYAAIREIHHLIVSEIPKSKWQVVKELAGLPRTILASGDFSFGGRQGLVYATSHPIEFAKAWPKQFKYFKEAFGGKDSEAYDAMMADIRSDPNYSTLEKYGHLLDPTGHDVAMRNEQFLSSNMADKIPIAGRLVRGSNYAFTGLHNTLYANQFYGMLEHLQYAGVKGPLLDDQLKKTAEAISTSLGRGGKAGGALEKHAGTLSTGLFAPRLMASRLNVMNPIYYLRLDGPARREALRGLLGLSAFATATLATAKLAGANVTLDPRSADFGKIRIGDTRLDPLGGFAQYIRLGRQLQSGQKINSTTGAQTEVGKGFAGSRLDIASNFLQSKENPSVSFVTTMLKGKDINGNNLYNFKGVSGQVLQRFIPLLLQDINDLQSHPNAVAGSTLGKIGAATAGVFGAGLQTYGAQDEPISAKQQTYLQNLKKQGAPTDVINADNSFFQSLKIAAAKKSTVNQSIDDAIKNKDLPKAQQLAEQYNKELAAGMTKWAQQYGEQYGNADLQQAYDRQKINLSPGSVRSRIKALTSTKPF